MKLGKFFIYINVLAFSLLMLTGCAAIGKWTPKIVYQPTSYRADNRTIEIEKGYALNDGHSYDIEWTDDGYDIIFHFVEEQS